MKLSDIQNSFLDSVFFEEKSLSYILPTHSNAEDTIEIYINSINAQLINTLKVVFPICQSMLGVEFFSAMCYQYVKLYPSESSSLNEYGKYMSIFMKDFKPLEDYPYFSDIALMEFAYDEIKRIPFVKIDNKDLSSFDESEYNGLVFKPVESLRTFSSPFKVAQIWKMHQEDDVREIDIGSETTYYMIYKSTDITEVKTVSYSEYVFLNASVQNLTLENIVEKHPEVIENLGEIISNILQYKVLQTIEN
jgi:hypothetical protein